MGIINIMQSNLPKESGFVEQISVSRIGMLVFKNFPSSNWQSSVLSTSKL